MIPKPMTGAATFTSSNTISTELYWICSIVLSLSFLLLCYYKSRSPKQQAPPPIAQNPPGLTKGIEPKPPDIF
jgi:hypothetical protein